jgi:hypothetical protein
MSSKASKPKKQKAKRTVKPENQQYLNAWNEALKEVGIRRCPKKGTEDYGRVKATYDRIMKEKAAK